MIDIVPYRARCRRKSIGPRTPRRSAVGFGACHTVRVGGSPAVLAETPGCRFLAATPTVRREPDEALVVEWPARCVFDTDEQT
ncbi:hypothetical protein CSW53_17485 [Rhodococcus ruber]|nr:hypothetical protein CSW53_17485 [Rhodococcus ruber]